MTSHRNVTHTASSFHTFFFPSQAANHMHLLLLLVGKYGKWMKMTVGNYSPHSLWRLTGNIYITRPKSIRSVQSGNCFLSLPSPVYFALLCTNNAFPRVNTQVNEVGPGHCKMLLNQPCTIIRLASEVLATAAPCSLIHSNEFSFNCFILGAH